MALVHRSWPVRVLAYAGTGIFILFMALVIGLVVAFLLWGLFAGPLWLQWTIGGPLLLILLTFVGRNYHQYHRKGF